ncbi:DUF6326 family protein [Mucilaginibacter sp.]|jgi:hypothetical protein|uniref:DUF6326 family protein n=1 Tax=Mucilaginibacter sp. TaxID=1882438 RepID=UPI0035615F92
MLTNTSVPIRFKLAGLWLTVFLLFIYGDLLSMWIPTRLNGLLHGKMDDGSTTPAKLLAIAIYITIYALMPLVNLIFSQKISGILNIIIAVLLIAFWLFILVSFSFDAMWNFYIYLAVLEIILALIIIYGSWRWIKSKA